MKRYLTAILLIFLSCNSYASATDQDDTICVNGECMEVLKREVAQVHKTLTVERVIDGDTLVADGITIRLWGIDAPERNEPLYGHTRLLLKQLIADKPITCKFIEFDIYKRQVMQCSDYQKQDLGAFLVKTGFAEDYPHYSGGYYQSEQELAKKLKLGIWQDTTR